MAQSMLCSDLNRLLQTGKFTQEQGFVSYTSDGCKVQSQEAKLVRESLLHYPGTERKKTEQERGG